MAELREEKWERIKQEKLKNIKNGIRNLEIGKRRAKEMRTGKGQEHFGGSGILGGKDGKST
jgi:hypothetical protein